MEARFEILERDPVASDFEGKRIRRFNFSACNIWRFEFDDGTSLAIEAEVMNTEWGGIPVMQICVPCGTIRDVES